MDRATERRGLGSVLELVLGQAPGEGKEMGWVL